MELKDAVGRTVPLGIASALFQLTHRCGCKVLNVNTFVMCSVLREAWTRVQMAWKGQMPSSLSSLDSMIYRWEASLPLLCVHRMPWPSPVFLQDHWIFSEDPELFLSLLILLLISCSLVKFPLWKYMWMEQTWIALTQVRLLMQNWCWFFCYGTCSWI